MGSRAKVILDSQSEAGARLITLELRYPLIIHNELLTHRMLGRSDEFEYEEWLEFSRNSSSNRARTSEDIIQEILADPYIPNFRYATTGMVPGDFFSEEDQDIASKQWLFMLHQQIVGVKQLQAFRAAKQWRNRPLSPWQYITTVVTANDQMWEGFFKLRDHHDAQDDLHVVAHMAFVAIQESTPTVVRAGTWHLPYITQGEVMHADSLEDLRKISVAKCARTSYARQGEHTPMRADIKLHDDLLTADPPHASPTEHQAMALDDPWERSGNFIGFKQYRKILGG